MKNLTITPPEGYEIDKEQSTFENIVFKPLNKVLPKTWKELEIISGFYINENSNIHEINKINTSLTSKNTFVTKEQAEASIALAQLSQLMKVYNEGWVPNWSSYEDKHIITFDDNKIKPDCFMFHQSFLAFKTKEIRDEFLKNFKELILTAKPLL